MKLDTIATIKAICIPRTPPISSPIINELLPRMIDDALKLTIDKEFTRSMKYADEESIFHVNGYDDKKNMWEKYSII